MDQVKLALLVYWIVEREQIRYRKKSGAPYPWTLDPILRDWRFCNVNRCEDTETKWIFDHIITLCNGSSVLWFNLAIARFVNWHPTLTAIGYYSQWDPQHFIRTLDKLSGKIYTGAYMIPAGPSGTIKHYWLAEFVFDILWSCRHMVPIDNTCAAWAEFFLKFDSIGPFLTNQIITDMRYTHHLEGAPDWDTFVLPGPGTQRGLNRLYGYPLEKKWTAAQASNALQFFRLHICNLNSYWVPIFKDINNVANCMCEFDKYCRVLQGEGKPRARYTPQVKP